ncbi:M23 family metallopeptidase [Streptomyces profundus]|uniref:M23 family metallopeptidase n=1 Tax=Streptomyces profundus TaxID=2867410 RepID=UPI001D16DA47|nr:M23 family metallopeptidase [Streptomyces sp. MA3_2.13]UED84918.1 M23 family metallopeptidase [Streptomyces sp. MA3_2.13]
MVLYRTCWAAFVAYLLMDLLAGLPMLGGWLLIATALTGQLGAALLARRDERGDIPPLAVAPPVAGRWSALNSPADRVPSHGTRVYGQSHAIDVVAEPAPGAATARPTVGWWPLARRNADFPAFGAPVLAVADGTVVHAVDGQRDHLSRNSYPAFVYLLAEGLLRDIRGPGRVIGNHLILDLGGGTYALYAHLRRGTLAVRPGERVRAGQEVARCGNSGNSSEPHLHFQLMDHPDPDIAGGLPFHWRGVGVPAARETFTAPAAGRPPEGDGRPAETEAGRSAA